jgi:hypothetical protein
MSQGADSYVCKPADFPHFGKAVWQLGLQSLSLTEALSRARKTL